MAVVPSKEFVEVLFRRLGSDSKDGIKTKSDSWQTKSQIHLAARKMRAFEGDLLFSHHMNPSMAQPSSFPPTLFNMSEQSAHFYENLTEIGRGSFAIVYKATKRSILVGGEGGVGGGGSGGAGGIQAASQTPSTASSSASSYLIKPGQTIAIKVVNRTKLNRKLQENLEMEIAILKKAKHRNVVALYQVLKSEKEISLVMEFCALGDLSLFIKKKGQVPGMPTSTSSAIAIAGLWGGLDQFVLRYLLAQLACAIEFLRFHRIIHRDLKPQNILLSLPPTALQDSISSSSSSASSALHHQEYTSPTAQQISLLPLLKLADFGFARSLEAESLASTLCGSPLYMAPEILKGERYDAKSDLWSLGAILYEMITGKPPFRAQNHIELLRKIERGDGWIRFPDEGPGDGVYDSTNAPSTSLQNREYYYYGGGGGGGGGRTTAMPGSLGYRKSTAFVPSTATAATSATRMGSLGSSPFAATPKVKSPVPEDLKTLTRRLLKRNPVERMGFEEFFISPTITEARRLDARLMESPQSSIIPSPQTNSTDGGALEEDSASVIFEKSGEMLGIKSLLSTLSSSSAGSSGESGSPLRKREKKSEKEFSAVAIAQPSPPAITHPLATRFQKLGVKNDLISDTAPLPPPFPSYGHDPNWSEKVLKKTTGLAILGSPPMNAIAPSASPQSVKGDISLVSIPAAVDIKFDLKEPVLEPPMLRVKKQESNILGSESSLGSTSLGSIEFSSDEEKETRTETVHLTPKIKRRSMPLQVESIEPFRPANSPSTAPFSPKNSHQVAYEEESDDFVVIERGNVDVKWNPNYITQHEQQPSRPPFSSSPVPINVSSASKASSVSSVSSTPLTTSTTPKFSTFTSGTGVGIAAPPLPVSSWSRPFQSISKALSSSLIYGSSPASGKSGSPSSIEIKTVTHPKGRLFGSLRADNSFIPHNHLVNNPASSTASIPPTLDPSVLTEALPFKLDLATLSPSSKHVIIQISMYVSRAFCISSLADQQWNELEYSETASIVIGSTDSKSQHWNALAADTLQLLVFAVGLYQYAMNQAKDFWKAGPAITNQGYSFSSSPPDNPHTYLAHLSTLINFIQTQFNMYLDKGDRLQKALSSSPASALDLQQMAKPAQRIIYETAISTCKRGALAELNGEGGLGFYKTSILLLQSILQPSWEESATGLPADMGKLEDKDQKEVQLLLDQITWRLYRHSSSSPSTPSP